MKGGARGQWPKGVMDETQGGMKGGTRGQWMKHREGMKGAQGGN